MYEDVIQTLRQAYDRYAAERDQHGIESWKVAERQQFLELLQAAGKERLLEIGAGPGRDSKFFQDHGLKVTCTDLSPEMVDLCRAKGLDAHVMDFLHLDFPDKSFDAVYALNCLLHVPKGDLAKVLANIERLLKPNGLFFMGVYGGHEFDGIWPLDHYEPKRYFAFYTDEQIKAIVSDYFDVIYFKSIELEDGNEHHFQSMILRRHVSA
ncbi:MAG: class I SAM-dependent methyltransferase [Chloroflexi bacterium]|nr:class I SAM-dependent methyltransferase [Chloroflexota bacterium]MCC6891603.1 class I SAM-dependent methyltransferase [Anaerolineae bacterium]